MRTAGRRGRSGGCRVVVLLVTTIASVIVVPVNSSFPKRIPIGNSAPALSMWHLLYKSASPNLVLFITRSHAKLEAIQSAMLT